eukprot:1150846-Pelagomonas_calceolata.AAC.2
MTGTDLSRDKSSQLGTDKYSLASNILALTQCVMMPRIYDEYVLVDGDKHARVSLTYGVEQDCPLPLLFSIYRNDM